MSAPPDLPPSPAPLTERQIVELLATARQRLFAEVGKVIVGQLHVIDEMLIALLSGGHCLITGAPGLAKTLLIKTVADVCHLSFQRIQFTPDLMPSDITGTEILEDTPEGGRQLVFTQGPVFANMILADEINRTPPKTQAALLEAMQEHQVTVNGKTMHLPEPFFVLATQNPIEQEGTYPLPEAQLDRFMLNIVIDYLSEDDEVSVVTRTTAGKGEPVQRLFTGDELLAFQQVVRKVPIAEDVARYAVRLSAASRPGREGVPDFVNQWISWGAGTRASQNLVLGAKTRCLLHNRTHVTADDIRAMALPVFRHRILVNYKAEAEGVTVEQVIAKLLETVKV
ncbi:MoxR family ATPase [Prosthecobacter sp.]|uniref:AAA family ATPase n=1 Tax=Prosthecobacter sp. TaxID=1965333 RepID=UPI001DC02FAA|nr:MoxR family ATPase [Prosthecobacter sp.]MCB1276652.1 MoxR family ATPase [Prosthecobacter sp.]